MGIDVMALVGSLVLGELEVREQVAESAVLDESLRAGGADVLVEGGLAVDAHILKGKYI